MSGSAVRHGSRRGFVLALVVFLLFAVGMASTVAFELVQSEWDMATGGEEAMEALAVARAGLDRYVAERIGSPVEHTYAIGEASVTVTPRKVRDDPTLPDVEIWYLEATASVADSRFPEDPAQRRAGMFARLYAQPVDLRANLMVSSTDVRMNGWGQVDGRDTGWPGLCAGGGSADTGGVLSRDASVPVSGSFNLNGSPQQQAVASQSDFMDLAGVRWDVLTSPSFPVAHDGSVPSAWSMAADSFPVVRITGDFVAGAGSSGQGVLIVTGRFQPSWGFWWEGIILAGELNLGNWTFWRLEGLMIAGLNGTQGRVDLGYYPYLYYNSCFAQWANRSLAYLEPLDDGYWEAY